MSFSIPAMPLVVNIWHDNGLGAYQDYTLPDVVTIGNIAPGHRNVGIQFAAFPLSQLTLALLPPLVDVRSQWNGLAPDLIEIPAGSKRFYAVRFVDDFGKGFANEHRYAILYYLPNGGTFVVQGAFPAPVPLP